LRVALVSPSSESNAAGRTHSLWLALRSVGVEVRTHFATGDEFWKPIADDTAFTSTVVGDLDLIRGWADIVVALKPDWSTIPTAVKISRNCKIPLVLDVDDPEYIAAVGTSSAQQRRYLRSVLLRRGGSAKLIAARQLSRFADLVLLSNPTLVDGYGSGMIVPHAREIMDPPISHSESSVLNVGFIGTPRKHKGLDVLRDAVSGLHSIRLRITAPEPKDHRPCEEWLGETSLAEGTKLLRSCDVAVIMSDSSVMGSRQLPAKLMDAMVHGLAIIASDVPAIRWASSGCAVLLDHADSAELATALGQMRDVHRRSTYGRLARSRAEELCGAVRIGTDLLSAFEGLVEK
jgi:glycosyltransferase involved in cell wall biosynthesis